MDFTPQKPSHCGLSAGHHRVRIVGRIRQVEDSEADSSNGSSTFGMSIRHHKGEAYEYSDIVVCNEKISCKEPYKLDYCYEENNNLEQIFSREVKPLIEHVFQGHNSSVLAYGARGTGKSYTIQGSDERPGLASLAIEEIFLVREEAQTSVSISFYEVYQDHVYDLLTSKEKEVFVLEDNGGRINLKGLTKVQINSVEDFNRVYLHGECQQKPLQRRSNSVIRTSHKGLIIYVCCSDENTSSTFEGKMSFMDLAGYEDAKQLASKGFHLSESAKANNKSLYALQNVLYAINGNDFRVPFRESKLTRMLQEYMGRTSPALVITCLNSKVTQDMIQTLSLSSRACQAGYQTKQDSSKKVMNKVLGPMNFSSPIAIRSKTPHPSSVKKSALSKSNATSKKMNNILAEKKEQRERIADTNSICDSLQVLSQHAELKTQELSIATEQSGETNLQDEATSTCSRGDNYTKVGFHDESQELFILSDSQSVEPVTEEDSIVHPKSEIVGSEKASFESPKGSTLRSEVPSSFGINKNSPPLSVRLREISNTLRTLSTTTANSYAITPYGEKSCSGQLCQELKEPKTPSVSFNKKENFEDTNINTPHEIYQTRSCGLKQSLVKEYLRYINSASKEELKKLQGIGEKRANYILELREISPEPFKDLDDLKDIGLSAKQVKSMMRKAAGAIFD